VTYPYKRPRLSLPPNPSPSKRARVEASNQGQHTEGGPQQTDTTTGETSNNTETGTV